MMILFHKPACGYHMDGVGLSKHASHIRCARMNAIDALGELLQEVNAIGILALQLTQNAGHSKM